MTLAWVAFVTVCIIWGTTYLAITVALETVPVLLVRAGVEAPVAATGDATVAVAGSTLNGAPPKGGVS